MKRATEYLISAMIVTALIMVIGHLQDQEKVMAQAKPLSRLVSFLVRWMLIFRPRLSIRFICSKCWVWRPA